MESGVWLAVMAIALVVMAIVQVALIVVALQLARRMTVMLDEIRREVRPVVDRIHRLADDAQRATSLAVTQVERIDALLATTAERVDEVLRVVQAAFSGPVRQGAAILAAVRAIVGAVRQWPPRERERREEEDPLFVG
jgi:hypothetical protein